MLLNSLKSSLLNCVPCMLRTCSLTTCLACLCARMPTALRAYALTCQCALCACVLMCKRAVLSNVNSCIIQICYLYLGLKRGNIGETLLSLLEIFTSSSVAFRSL